MRLLGTDDSAIFKQSVKLLGISIARTENLN
jgi:hypothetical protein